MTNIAILYPFKNIQINSFDDLFIIQVAVQLMVYIYMYVYICMYISVSIMTAIAVI